MPSAVAGAPQRSEQIWQALKAHILRERQRKKQEQEADAEEERQRKERERQQKQDVMTIGETREQIATLETELAQLKNEKHQLFVQLKKVLHEDDNRRRLIKETTVLLEPVPPMGSYLGDPNTSVHGHVYLPLPTRNSLFKVSTATTSHNLLQSGPLKRSHSPSPPPPPPPVSSYHPGYGYKGPPSMSNYMPLPPKNEDVNKRSGDARVVLWNKNNQFPGSNYYAPSVPYDFGPPSTQPIIKPPDPGKSLYLPVTRPSIANIQTAPFPDEKFYVRPGSLVNVHSGPIQPMLPVPKTGSITSGYPIRAPQATQDSYPPSSVTYVSVAGATVPSRVLYTQPGRYIPREM